MEITEDLKRKDKMDDFKSLYQHLPEDKKKLVFPLLDNLMFINKRLQELQKAIQSKGMVEEYRNGSNQRGNKLSASIQAYCSLLKSYTTIYSKVIKLTSEQKDTAGSKLESIYEEFGDE